MKTDAAAIATTADFKEVSSGGKRNTQAFTLMFLLTALAGCFFFALKENSIEIQNDVLRIILHYGNRIAIVGLSLLAWFKTQALLQARGSEEEKIRDALHELSAPLLSWLHLHPKAADAVLIVSSAFIDLLGLFIICAAIFGASIRGFLAFLILYSLRQIFQFICALPKPPGMIWRNPGFPSLLVTYEVENDFYFSGHTSIAVLAAIELFQISPYLGLAAGVIALFEMIVVIVLRAHYTMDVFTAVLAAICSSALAGWLCSALGGL